MAQVTFREFAQDYTIITDASADASVVVGLYDTPTSATVFRWTASGGVQLIGAPGMYSDCASRGQCWDAARFPRMCHSRHLAGWNHVEAARSLPRCCPQRAEQLH